MKKPVAPSEPNSSARTRATDVRTSSSARPTAKVRAARLGLAPLAVGLVLASGWILTRGAAQHAWAAYVLTAATAFLALRTRWNPLWLLLGGALVGWLGWV